MSNLIPTPRVDKNGNVVIRHMRPSGSSSERALLIPTVTSSAAPTKRTNKARMTEISKLLKQSLVAAKTRKFLAESTPEQLDRLDAVLRDYDAMPDREKSVVVGLLRPLSMGRLSAEFIHESLALRSAFCSPWAEENSAAMDYMGEYICGTRDAFGISVMVIKPMEFRDERELQEAVAITRFLFETDRRFPRKAFRPADPKYVQEANISFLQYKDPVLVELLREHCDRVDELIEFIAEHETCDPQILRAFLEHDGATSLSSGYL